MTQIHPPHSRSSIADAFHRLGYEVLPFKGTFENVLENVPKTTHLTVTASPPKGIAATIELATKLAGEGYSVAPHLSARMIADKHELNDILDSLVGAKISSLFVIGGDGDPKGSFTDSIQLLRAIRDSDHSFADIGIGGYPEGHALIPAPALMGALKEKAKLADHITTQICFNATTITSWADSLVHQGVDLPVRVGVPGAVSRQKLIKITGSIGLGDSAKFLRKQKNMFWRFFLPGGYSPNKIIAGLKPALTSASTVQDLHIFTFNELKATEAWRRQMLDRFGN